MVFCLNDEFNLTTLMHDIEVIDNGTRFHKCLNQKEAVTVVKSISEVEKREAVIKPLRQVLFF